MVTLLAKDFIEAEATDVLEVHRSENPVFLNDGKTEWEAQAFICLIKQKNQPKIHVAFRLRDLPASLLYIAEPPPSAPTDTEQARQQAHALTQLLGASLHEVNLKHSPAMREVILREIPVLLPPETARRISREKEMLLSEYRQLLNDQAARQEVLAADGELSLAQWTKRKEELDALAGNAAQAADYLEAEERATARISALQKALVPFLKKVNAAELAAEEKLKKERLQKEQATAVQQKAELQERILLLEKELARWKKEGEVLTQAKAAGDKELSRLQQTLAQTEKSLKAAEAQLKTSEVARAEAENRCAALEKGLRQQEKIEKEGKEKLNAALNELQKTRELLTLSLAERQKLEAEPANKSTSQGAAEASGAENGSRKRLLQLESDLQGAEERAEILRLEVERLAAEKTLAEKRIATLEAAAVLPAKKMSAATAAGTVSRTEPDPPHVVRRPPPAGALFRVDWDLAGIETTPEEICEMHQAMTRVRLSLEGYPNQSCAAYLLVTRKAEETKIHIAFYLTASNRVLIYIPVRKPESPEAIAQTLKEAHKFLQVVGIDLEPFPLPKDRKKQIEILAEVPVLLPAARNAGNS